MILARALTTFSLDEVAEALGCTPRWLTEQVRAGRFPAHRIASQWRFTEANCEKILALCTNDFRQPIGGTGGSVPVTSTASGLTARSRKRVVGLTNSGAGFGRPP
ncbi:MAG: helix-turn-helix domain-containing protein [Mycobacteriaceae bacterium]|nr:helix-turn-helix domain-containing protein [Mycobacteriaceae bacterium]